MAQEAVTNDTCLTSEEAMAVKGPSKPEEYEIPGQYEYRGVVFGAVVPGIELSITDVWTANPRQYLIATYPKSGTTWMAGLLPLVDQGGDIDAVNALGHVTRRAPFVEMGVSGAPTGLDLVREGRTPTYMKTHLQYDFFQRQIEEQGLRVVFLVRNIKDVLVSYYHMYRNLPVLGPCPHSFNEYFELFRAKKLIFGDPVEWNREWWLKKDQPNILTLKYEDMIADCASAVRKIAAFCGRDLDEEAVTRTVQHCAIDSMRKDPMMLVNTINDEKLNFFRKGVVGDWKNYFNQEQSDYVDRLCKERLEPIGLTFDCQ